jgi:uncharacterized protein (TIGR02246 family)
LFRFRPSVIAQAQIEREDSGGIEPIEELRLTNAEIPMLILSQVAAISVLVLASAAQAADADELAIRDMVDQAVSRLNRGDVTAFDLYWDERAEYVGVDGWLVKGRANIQALFRKMLANGNGGHQSVTVDHVRFITPRLATVDGSWTVTGARDSNGNELAPVNGKGFELVQKKDGRWRFIATREMVIFGGSPGQSPPGIGQPASDEQQLRDIQRRLARAWLQRDRAFIETVLAPEWSVTQADGHVLTRAEVLGPFFDGLRLDTSAVDEVSVMLFGAAAVVRGRTVASAMLNGAQVSARIRFTDILIKRDDRWQAVASHASPLLGVAGGPEGAAAGAENPLPGNWTAAGATPSRERD